MLRCNFSQKVPRISKENKGNKNRKRKKIIINFLKLMKRLRNLLDLSKNLSINLHLPHRKKKKRSKKRPKKLRYSKRNFGQMEALMAKLCVILKRKNVKSTTKRWLVRISSPR